MREDDYKLQGAAGGSLEMPCRGGNFCTCSRLLDRVLALSHSIWAGLFGVSGFVYATIDCFWSHTEHVNFSIVDQPESGRARSFALLWGPLRLEYKVDAAETGLTRKKERASIKVTPSANPITIPTMFARPLALANGGTCADASRIRRENDSKVEMGQRAARRPARWFRGAANVCRLQLQGGAGSACCGALERTLAVNKRVYSRDISKEGA